MKRVIGFDFTDYTVRILHEKGFSLTELRTDDTQGFRRFLCPLGPSTNHSTSPSHHQSASGFDGFEIHVIEDEEAYLRHAHLEHFFPLVHENSETVPVLANANTVEELIEVIEPASLTNRELKEALELRKQFQICALRLKCRDFAKFIAVARPQRVYLEQGRELALLHLGPSCFDLLISAD